MARNMITLYVGCMKLVLVQKNHMIKSFEGKGTLNGAEAEKIVVNFSSSSD